MKKSSRIIALIGIILLAALYISTMVFAFMKSPAAKHLLMAAVACTIIIPVLLYILITVTNRVQGKRDPFSGKEPYTAVRDAVERAEAEAEESEEEGGEEEAEEDDAEAEEGPEES